MKTINNILTILISRTCVVLSIALFATSSCTTLYSPITHNVPMMSEKGELQITPNLDISTIHLDVSAASNFSSIAVFSPGLQASYAVSDNIAIMANGQLKSFYYHDWWDDLKQDKHGFLGYPYSYAEAAVGYYESAQFNENNDYFFEVYGGAGTGRIYFSWLNNYDYLPFEDRSGKITKYFIQPSYGISMLDSKIKIGIAGRLSYLGVLDYRQIVVEPGIVFRAGNERFSFNFNAGASAIVRGEAMNWWEKNSLIGSVGFTYRLFTNRNNNSL